MESAAWDVLVWWSNWRGFLIQLNIESCPGYLSQLYLQSLEHIFGNLAILCISHIGRCYLDTSSSAIQPYSMIQSHTLSTITHHSSLILPSKIPPNHPPISSPIFPPSVTRLTLLSPNPFSLPKKHARRITETISSP